VEIEKEKPISIEQITVESMETSPLKVKGQLEWANALQAHLLHTHAPGLVRIVVNSPFVFVGCPALLLSLFDLVSLELLFILLLVAGLVIFARVIQRFVLLPKMVWRIFIQNKEVNIPYKLEIDEAGLTLSNEFGQTKHPWTYYLKWKENKEYLLLYHFDLLFAGLPKRLFSDSVVR